MFGTQYRAHGIVLPFNTLGYVPSKAQIESEPSKPQIESVPELDLSLSTPSYLRKLFWISLIPFLLIFYFMYEFSEQWNDNAFRKGEPLRLQKGWLFGRSIDLSDDQWSSFRSFIPILFAVGTLHVIISQTLRRQFGVKLQIIFNILFSLLFIGYLHQATIIFPILTATINYGISRYFKASYWTVILTWTFNLIVLFSSKHFNGYRFADISDNLAHLDEYRGVFNWATCFNISMCRLVSFNIDYYQALKQESESNILRKKYSQTIQSEWSENRKRQERVLYPDRDYDFLHYFMYIFYVPLYIGGPVTGYNAFYSFVEHKPQQECTTRDLIKMGARIILYIIALEFMLHFIYSVGFSENRFWESNTPLQNRFYVRKILHPMTSMQICMNGVMVLIFMYMKFLIIWRFFRLWSLTDGINPPENMVRCIINNYSISGFWRSWHRSLYYFILRYIYVPLGGNKSKVWSVWIIFLFIAVWHDLWLRWVAWAMFNCCGMIAEMIVVHAIAKTKPIQAIKKVSNNSTKPYYFFMVMTVGAISYLIMIISNLAIMYGFNGTALMLSAILNGEGAWKVVLIILYFMPISVCGCLMYEEREARLAREKKALEK